MAAVTESSENGDSDLILLFTKNQLRLNFTNATNASQINNAVGLPLTDNLQALVALTAHADAKWPEKTSASITLRPRRAQAADACHINRQHSRKKGAQTATGPACLNCWTHQLAL